MITRELVWRDRVILVLSWGILVWAALTSWAIHAGFGASPIEIRGFTFSTQVLFHIHTGILVLVILLPAILLGLYPVTKNSRPFSRLIDSFQQPKTIYLLLAAFAVSPLIQTFVGRELGRLKVMVSFFGSVTVVLLLCWLFYKRDKIALVQVVLPMVWAITFLSTIQTLSGLLEREESWAAGYGIAFTGLLVLLTNVPPILWISPLRRRLVAAMEWGRDLPLWAYSVLFTLPLVCLLVYWLLGEPPHLQPIVRLFAMQGVLTGGIFAIKLWERAEPDERGPTPDGSVRGYTVWLLILVAGYLLLAIPLAINWTGALNADGLSYLTIARSYAGGSPVVRGLWPPLLSWLLAPLIASGVDPEAAARILVVINGLPWILITLVFARRFALNPKIQLATGFAMTVLVLKYSFWPVTPEFLYGTILLLYFYLVLDKRFVEYPVRFGVIVGVVGALGYYAKHINLPYFIAHLSLTGLLLWTHGRPMKQTVTAIATALVTSILVISPWVILLSMRFGSFTVSSAGPYNNAYYGPINTYRPFCRLDGLCDKPEDVLFPWEEPDPGRYLPFTWSPFDSWEHFQFQLSRLKTRMRFWTQDMVFRLGMLGPLALFGFGLAALAAWPDIERRLLFIWLPFSVILFALAYAVSGGGELRYYYPLFPLLVIAIYTFAQLALEKLPGFGADAHRVTLRYLGLLLLLGPIIVFAFKRPNVPKVSLFRAIDRCTGQDSLAMDEYLTAPMAGSDSWIQWISYYTEKRTYGVVTPGAAPAHTDRELREFGVATFIASEESGLPQALSLEYGYAVVAKVEYCGEEYTVLRVPPAGEAN